jgi:hypothetical protein
MFKLKILAISIFLLNKIIYLLVFFINILVKSFTGERSLFTDLFQKFTGEILFFFNLLVVVIFNINLLANNINLLVKKY